MRRHDRPARASLPDRPAPPVHYSLAIALAIPIVAMVLLSLAGPVLLAGVAGLVVGAVGL